MNEDFPYSKMILSTDKTKWEKFSSVYGKLQLHLTNKQNFLNELFALYLILNEQYQKWFVIASNKTNTNDQTKVKIEKLFEVLKVNLIHRNSQLLTNQSFTSRSFLKIILQTLQIDFIFYGDKLRTNEKDANRWLELHRNFGLTMLNTLLFYGLPVLLILWNPIFILLLFISFIGNFIFAYRRTKLFYFMNQLEKIKNAT